GPATTRRACTRAWEPPAGVSGESPTRSRQGQSRERLRPNVAARLVQPIRRRESAWCRSRGSAPPASWCRSPDSDGARALRRATSSSRRASPPLLLLLLLLLAEFSQVLQIS